MELEKVESDLLALRQLYGLLQNIGQGLQSKTSEDVSSLISKQSVFLRLTMSWSLDFQLYYFSTTLIILAMGKINKKQLINLFFYLFLNFNFSPQALWWKYTLSFWRILNCTSLFIAWFDYSFYRYFEESKMCKEYSFWERR